MILIKCVLYFSIYILKTFDLFEKIHNMVFVFLSKIAVIMQKSVSVWRGYLPVSK